MTTSKINETMSALRKTGFLVDKRPDVILFLDDHRGIYIPRDFAESIKRESIAYPEQPAGWRRPDCETALDADLEILKSGPDHESYWDVWSDVCDNAIVTDSKGYKFRLYQDGALFLIPVGMEYDEETDSHFWATPMKVSISDSDDDNGSITVYCEDKRQARLDQSVSLDGQSSNWECPRDMDVAYASLCNFYDLAAALTAAGYEVDDSEYTPPDAEDLAYWAYRNDAECDGSEVLDRDAWLALKGKE